MLLAVCGLHLRGEALNGQLEELGAVFSRSRRSADKYRMVLIEASGVPSKPGMVWDPLGGAGCGTIDLELWEISDEAVGKFLQMIPAPLGLGTVRLEDGGIVYGFTCEGWVLDENRAKEEGISVKDITQFGGWRAWKKSC